MDLKEKYVTDEQGNRIGILLDIEELEAIQTYHDAILSDDEEITFEVVVAEIENSRQ